MHVDPHTVQGVIAFITGGGLLAVVSQIVKVVRAIRAGIPVRESRARLDIVKQRDAAVTYGHELREDLLEAGVPRHALRPWPSILKESA